MQSYTELVVRVLILVWVKKYKKVWSEKYKRMNYSALFGIQMLARTQMQLHFSKNPDIYLDFAWPVLMFADEFNFDFNFRLSKVK